MKLRLWVKIVLIFSCIFILITLYSRYIGTNGLIVKEYQKALQSANKDEIAAAEDALEAAIMVGEAADKYGLDEDVLEAQAKQIRRYNQ